jgi:hypothetical protein
VGIVRVGRLAIAVGVLLLSAVTGASVASASPLPLIDAGGVHSCGVKRDATVICWGDNLAGQATAPAGSFSSVSAGYFVASQRPGDEFRAVRWVCLRT